MNAFERQFAGDPRFHIHNIPEHLSGSHFAGLVAAEQAHAHIINDRSDIILRVGDAGATPSAGCCSVVILHGEQGSSHWLFGHIDWGRGFPHPYRLTSLRQGIVGQATLYLIGAGPLDPHGVFEADKSARRGQIDCIHQQVNDCHISLLRQNMFHYWNDELKTYINVVARVGESGLESAHITHVRL